MRSSERRGGMARIAWGTRPDEPDALRAREHLAVD